MYNILTWTGSSWKISRSSYVSASTLSRKGNRWSFRFTSTACWILVFHIARSFNNVGNILLAKASLSFKACLWSSCTLLGFVGAGHAVSSVHRCTCYANHSINKWNTHTEWNSKILKFCDWIISALVDIYSNDWM